MHWIPAMQCTAHWARRLPHMALTSINKVLVRFLMEMRVYSLTFN